MCVTNTKRIKQNKNNKTDHISYSREKINICATHTKCIKQSKNNKANHVTQMFIFSLDYEMWSVLLFLFCLMRFVCVTQMFIFSLDYEM
jgi:hypothetical protein